MNLIKTARLSFYGGLVLHIRVLENFDDFVKHKWPQTFSGDVKTTHATSFLDWPDAWIVFRFDCITHSTIAHENQHITLRAMREIGMTESIDSEEAYCYLMGWLAETVYGTLLKNKLKIDLK